MTANSLDLSESGEGEGLSNTILQENALHPELAATKIQAIARGRKARKDVQQKRQTIHVPVNNELAAAIASGEVTSADLADAIIAGLDPQIAATRIQSIARGRKARKEVADKRRTVLLTKEEQINLEKQEEIEEHPHAIHDPDQAKAATKIQSIARGRQARKRVSSIRQIKDANGNVVEVEVTEEEAKVEESETKVEDDGIVAPTVDITDDDKTSKAATKIQSVARGRQARKRVIKMKDASGNVVDVEVTEETATPEQTEGKVEETETKTDESEVGFVSPVPDENDEAKSNKAATKIQSVARGRQARKRVIKMKDASGNVVEVEADETTPVEGEPIITETPAEVPTEATPAEAPTETSPEAPTEATTETPAQESETKEE